MEKKKRKKREKNMKQPKIPDTDESKKNGKELIWSTDKQPPWKTQPIQTIPRETNCGQKRRKTSDFEV